MEKKHCSGCYEDFYNGRSEGDCWSLKKAKLVWRIPIGHWENPPYKNKKKKLVPSCWHGIGNQRTHYVEPVCIGADGYWR